MDVDVINFLMASTIFGLTLLSGLIPFLLKSKNPGQFDFPVGVAIANGVFLGAGLIHMLSRSTEGFSLLGYIYPWSFLICGATFLLFLLSEHIGFFLKDHGEKQSLVIAVISTIMLSIHSFLAGAALGISGSIGMSVILFLAILAHKWAASFSLSVYINKTEISLSGRLVLFLFFSLMVPLGIFFGDSLHHHFLKNELLEPIFSAMAAGTFIYLGTLHGFRKLLTQHGCCNLYQYFFVIFGFALMAVVAIWI